MKTSLAIGCLLAALLATTSGFAAPDGPGGKIYRIMPLGDSITEGGGGFVSYRHLLLEKLSAAGYRVEYVGSRTNQSPVGPLRHEGYSGKTTEFLATNVAASFRQHPADIVLLHSGHNHTSAEQPVAKIVAATESIITICRKINPRVVVLLAQVIPSGKLPKYDYLPELNVELARLAVRLNTATQPVLLVNQAEGFDWHTDTVADKVHPNARGAEKMAGRWFAALTQVLEKPEEKSRQLRANQGTDSQPQ